MIINSIRTSLRNNRRRMHGMAITIAQLNVLKAWIQWEQMHLYPPTQKELRTMSGSNSSQISMWMNEWEELGLVTRGEGQRSDKLTDKGRQLVADYEELNNLWNEYIDKRRSVLDTYGSFTYCGETPYSGLSG